MKAKDNPVLMRKYRKKWRDANAKRCHFLSRQWERANRAHVNARAKQWRDSHPEASKAARLRSERKRRAQRMGALISAKSIELYVSRIRAMDFATCYYCDASVPGKLVHFDHIIPLSKGGAHSVENLCVSCEHCNCSKQATLLQDWFKLGQQILNL